MRKWGNMAGMTLVRATKRQEAHRKQQAVDRKEQVPSSSSSLCVPLAFPINRASQEVNWQSKNDVCRVPAQHHKVEDKRADLD